MSSILTWAQLEAMGVPTRPCGDPNAHRKHTFQWESEMPGMLMTFPAICNGRTEDDVTIDYVGGLVT